IGERGRRALVRDVRELDLRHGGEQLRAEVNAAADACRGVSELAWLFPGERNELGDALCRNVVVDQNDQGRRRDQADRGEVLARVVPDVRIERRVDRERAGAAEAKRVAVCWCLRDLAGRDRAPSPPLSSPPDL